LSCQLNIQARRSRAKSHGLDSRELRGIEDQSRSVVFDALAPLRDVVDALLDRVSILQNRIVEIEDDGELWQAVRECAGTAHPAARRVGYVGKAAKEGKFGGRGTAACPQTGSRAIYL
jgi:hypothetical protein